MTSLLFKVDSILKDFEQICKISRRRRLKKIIR